MYLSLINLLPVFLTFSAAFGIFMHDTQLDKAGITAIVAPVQSVNYGSVDEFAKFNDPHIHSERINISTNNELQNSQPTLRPRGEDKKYIVTKKLVSNTSGSEYSWPSR